MRTQVILTAPIPDKGWEVGSVVEVAGGYARNFLFPKGLAIPASESNLNIREKRIAAHQKKRKIEISAARLLANTLADHPVHMQLTIGENGKAHGAITAKQIAGACRAKHELDIAPNDLKMDTPLKAVGKYTIPVRLDPEVTGELTVIVEGRSA